MSTFYSMLFVFFAYFIGNFDFAYIIVKLIKNEDIRNYGSGNAGTTNVLRVAGVKYALPVFVLDAAKGALIIVLAHIFHLPEYMLLFGGIAVIAGHNWPILLNYKGGKGTATTIGVFLALDYKVALICISIGLIILFVFKMVSLTSIVGISIAPFFVMLLYGFSEPMVLALAIFCAFSTVFQHRTNIIRIINKTESKIGQKSSMNKKDDN